MLRNSEDVALLLQDWRQVDVESIILQAQQNGSICYDSLFRECEYYLNKP